MPAPLFALGIWTALRTVIKWLVKFIFKWLFTQLIIALVAYFASSLIVSLVDAVSEKIKEFNNFVLTKVFVVEDSFFTLQHNVYDKVDEIWLWLKTKIDEALSSLLPEQIDLILALVNFAGWVDTLFSDIAVAVGDSVKAFVEGYTTPIVTRLQALLDTLNAAELKIETSVKALYDQIEANITKQQEQYNQKISTLFAEVNAMADFYNAAILEIRGSVKAEQTALAVFNSENPARVREWIRANFQPGTYTQDQVDALAYSALLEFSEPDKQAPIDPLAIDFDQYIYTLAPDAADYQLAIEIPPYTFDLTALVPELQTIRTEVISVRDLVAALPDQAEAHALEALPDFLSARFRDRIQQFLVIAITTAIMQKKNEIEEYFGGVEEQILAEMEEGKQAIIQRTKEIVESIEQFELDLVAKLPDVLEPTLQKAIKAIESSIAEKQDEVLVNIDSYVPDTTEIDHLVESFPRHINANPNPNKFDTIEWTLADIYRMLCNYFSRNERIALIIYLAAQDLELDESELAALFPTNGESEDEPVDLW